MNRRYKNPMLVESMRLRLDVSTHQNSKTGSRVSERMALLVRLTKEAERKHLYFMSFIQAGSRRCGPDEGWLFLPQKSRLKVGFPTLNDF